MKTFLLVSLSAFSLCCLSFYGCQEDALPEGKVEDSIIVSERRIQIPEGTLITKVSDSESKLDLPEGVFFVATDDEPAGKGTTAISILSETAGVRCRCTSGSGCNPTKRNGEYGCVMTTNCNSCELSTTNGAFGKSSSEDLIDIKGLLDMNQGITFLVDELTGDFMQDAFLSTRDETYGNAFGELFGVEAVKESILEFYSIVYEGDIPAFILRNEKELPAGYSYVMMNIYGNIAAMPFPDDKIQEDSKSSSSTSYLVMDAKGISCECHTGGNSYVNKSAAMGSVRYCDAGCRTMH